MKNWKIGARIMAGFAVVIAITMILGLYTRNRVHGIAVNTDEVATVRLPSMLELAPVPGNYYHVVALLWQRAASSDQHDMDQLQAEIAELRAINARHVQAYAVLPAAAEEKVMFEEYQVSRTKFWATVDHVIAISRLGTPASNQQAHDFIEQQLIPQSKTINGLVQQIMELNNKTAVDGMAEIQGSVSSTNRGVLIGLALCLALAIPITLLIARGITRPLNQAVATLGLVAGGDLTVSLDVHTKDELGQMATALNTALEKLRSTLVDVAASAEHSNSSSGELAAAARQIASGAQEQAASLEETSASLEQITAAVRQSADNARQASQLAIGSRESAEQGQGVISNAIAAMSEINVASAKIADITSTINDIAFQTNLLAVNAAVEAARAGEEGRGFAVVAAEVRSLAQRTAEAAKEIKSLIQDSLQKVEKGSELVNQSGTTLQGIVGSVKRVTDIVGEIAAASAEQSLGVDQVNTAITQMDHVTQSNSSQTEELSATAQSFADQATGLMDLISIFTLGNGQSSRGEPRHQPSDQSTSRSTGAVRRVGKAAGKGKLASSVANGTRQHTQTAALVGSSAGGSNDASFEEF